MKTIKLDELQPDPVAAALLSSDKETVTVSGYICATDKATISVCETRDGISYIEYPRSAVIAAFMDEESEQVTLLVDANARVRAISATKVGYIHAQLRPKGGAGCGTECQSSDGTAKCCCGVGQRCKSGSTTCVCEDASGSFFPTNSGYLASMQKPDAPELGFAANPNFGAGVSSARAINWQCYSQGGICPITCYPIVVNGRIVDYYCYCDCRHPIPINQTKIS